MDRLWFDPWLNHAMLNRAVQLLREVRRGPVNPFMLGFEILVA
jgi:hypothetical protein